MPIYALMMVLSIFSTEYPTAGDGAGSLIKGATVTENHILRHAEIRRDMTLIDCSKLMGMYSGTFAANRPYIEVFRDPGPNSADPVRKVIITFNCEPQGEKAAGGGGSAGSSGGDSSWGGGGFTRFPSPSSPEAPAMGGGGGG